MSGEQGGRQKTVKQSFFTWTNSLFSKLLYSMAVYPSMSKEKLITVRSYKFVLSLFASFIRGPFQWVIAAWLVLIHTSFCTFMQSCKELQGMSRARLNAIVVPCSRFSAATTCIQASPAFQSIWCISSAFSPSLFILVSHLLRNQPSR